MMRAVLWWFIGVFCVLALHAVTAHGATPTASVCVVSDGTLYNTTMYNMTIGDGLWYRRHAVSVTTDARGVTRLVTTLEWEQAK
jgi:hypothetical protein